MPILLNFKKRSHTHVDRNLSKMFKIVVRGSDTAAQSLEISLTLKGYILMKKKYWRIFNNNFWK